MVRALAALCLAALAAAACGGGGETEPARAVPTLTDPASVPIATASADRTPFLIGEDTISDPGGGAIARAPQPGAATIYTVVEGDTCGAIASGFGIALRTLLDENPAIDEDCTNLAIGAELRIPAAEPDAGGDDGGGEPAAGAAYIVVQGDTCSGIAGDHDVPLATFLSVNGLTDESCTRLSIGQELTIPR